MPEVLEVAKNCAASGLAAGTSVGLMNPLDTLRIRWQVSPASSGTGLVAFARTIIAQEGIWRGLYRPALPVNMLSMGTSAGIRVGIYPFVRDAIMRAYPDAGKTAAIMGGAGFGCGALGYGISTPIFQVKTRIQAEAGAVCAATGLYTTGARAGHRPAYPDGLLRAWGTIARTEGPAALYRGAGALVVRGAMFSAGQMLGYDGSKSLAKDGGLLADGPALHVAASAVAAFFATAFSAPADILLTRYQSGPTLGVAYGSLLECARAMVREEGVGVFFRGWTLYWARISPVFLIYHPLYEQFRLVCGMGYLD